MNDDELPVGITREEWTALEPEDRLLLLLGADQELAPEERAEITQRALQSYSAWMTNEPGQDAGSG
jgi:hypothetical protein